MEEELVDEKSKGHIRDDFFEIISAQRDIAPEMKPKKFMRGIIAEGIHKPSSTVDVKKLLKKNKYVIRGSGSTFTGSILPHQDEYILHTNKLDFVNIKKEVAHIGGGTPFYKIINEAKNHNLEVPCYPLSYKSATIGGFISNNGIVGFNSRGTGYLFDYIEEMEVVTPSGTTYKVRGDDVKDFFGAEGKLGVIVSLKLKLLKKETHYIHMYGFDGIEDVLRFLELNDGIYAFYLLNKTALSQFEKGLQLKHTPEYTAIVIDKNWKSDYQKKLRTDLAKLGVSHVFSKEIVRYCFKRIGKLELSILSGRKGGHIGDGTIKIDDCYKVLRIAKIHNLPLFANIGKKELLYRVYFDCTNKIKRQKFMVLMDRFHAFSEPNCVGSFFAESLSGTSRQKRMDDTQGKYDSKIGIVQRSQLYTNHKRRKFFSGVISLMGGRLW